MTTITPGSWSTASASLSQASTGAAFVLAAGIAGSYLNPLGAGRNAFAQLASTWALSLGSASQPQQEPQAQWTVNTGSNGHASIDLGDGYSMQLNENNSEITITNAATGETTQIWGDPHVNVNGEHAFDFWGTTTFTLENGTKITIDTEQYAKNPDAYLASKVTITKGDQAIVVDGISQNQLGDLSISMSQDGEAIDAATRDGFVLEENATGAGWRSQLSGDVATQKDLDVTRVGQAYGPGSSMPSLDELSGMLGNFLNFGILLGMASSLGEAAGNAPARAIAWPGAWLHD